MRSGRITTAAEIAAYVAGGDWRGKAGGYGIQGPAAAFAPWIQGSFTAVVGLPLAMSGRHTDSTRAAIAWAQGLQLFLV